MYIATMRTELFLVFEYINRLIEISENAPKKDFYEDIALEKMKNGHIPRIK